MEQQFFFIVFLPILAKNLHKHGKHCNFNEQVCCFI